MESKRNIRKMAIKAIDLIASQKALSTQLINKEVKEISDKLDQSLYRELVYGSIENLFYLDYIIDKASKIKTKKMQKTVLNALRLGVYELVFLRIENYATINEIVKIIKREEGQRTGNFVNAVLRNISRNIEEFKKIDIKDRHKYLSIKYSFHIDIVRYLDKYYSDDLEDLLKALYQRPSMSIRVNTMKVSKADLSKQLLDKGFETKESTLAKDALIVLNPVNITNLNLFKKGYFTIQDQGSIKVAEILDPLAESEILDLCAAPGSKSTHLAQLTEDKSLVIANDISKYKNKKIKENFSRLGFNNYQITNHDATNTVEEFKQAFDYVLVDAPCSGLGVVMRKPDIKLFRTMKDIKALVKIQRSILSQAVKYLKKGGYLVYSSCTIGALENQENVDYLLSIEDKLEIVPIDEQPYLEILPHKSESDGFFIAKFQLID